MRTTGCSILALALAAGLTGCGEQKAPAPMASTAPVSAAQGQFEAAWGATLDVLTQYEFRVDRQDRYQGIISTYPVTGKSWFEFWRKDGATAYDTCESSIQTIYRSAVVHVIRVADSDEYNVQVEVKVARSDRPNMQISNTSEAMGLFRAAEGGRLNKYLLAYGEGMDLTPVPLPNDANLAGKIKAEIDKRMAQRLIGH